MRCARRLQLSFLLALSLVLPVASRAQASSDNTLSNADIVRMVKASIPEGIILREIELSETNFVTSANALIELKKQHVPDSILNAILDSRIRTSGPQVEPSSTPVGVVPSAAPSPHRLPAFDAAVRLDSKTTAKITVRQNNIKVERSGVPLFSLKWKELHSQ